MDETTLAQMQGCVQSEVRTKLWADKKVCSNRLVNVSSIDIKASRLICDNQKLEFEKKYGKTTEKQDQAIIKLNQQIPLSDFVI